MNTNVSVRSEKDLLGYRDIPNQFYFGVQTLRAIENFNLTHSKISNHPNFIINTK